MSVSATLRLAQHLTPAAVSDWTTTLSKEKQKLRHSERKTILILPLSSPAAVEIDSFGSRLWALC